MLTIPNAYIEFLKDHEKEREAFYDDVKQIYQAIFGLLFVV